MLQQRFYCVAPNDALADGFILHCPDCNVSSEVMQSREVAETLLARVLAGEAGCATTCVLPVVANSPQNPLLVH